MKLLILFVIHLSTIMCNICTNSPCKLCLSIKHCVCQSIFMEMDGAITIKNWNLEIRQSLIWLLRWTIAQVKPIRCDSVNCSTEKSHASFEHQENIPLFIV